MNDTNDVMTQMMARAIENMNKPAAGAKVNEKVDPTKSDAKPVEKVVEAKKDDKKDEPKTNESDKKDDHCEGKCDGKCGKKNESTKLNEAEGETGSKGDTTGDHVEDVNPTGSKGDKAAGTEAEEEPEEVMIAQEGENAFYVHLEGSDSQAKVVITDADDQPLFTSEPVNDLAGKFQELIKGADTLKIPQISVDGLKALGLEDLLQALKQAAQPQEQLPSAEDDEASGEDNTEDVDVEGEEEDEVPRESKKPAKTSAKKFGGDGKGGFKTAKKNEGVVPDFSKDDPDTVLKKLIEQRDLLNKRIAFRQRIMEQRAKPARKPMSLKEWAARRQELIEAKKKEKLAKAKKFGGDGKGGFKKTGGK